MIHLHQDIIVDCFARTVNENEFHRVVAVGDVDGPGENIRTEGHGVVLGEGRPGVEELLGDGRLPDRSITNY